MATHRLDATRATTVEVLDRDAPAALTVDPGDTVVVRALDASGHLERQRRPGEQRPRMFEPGRGHCLTGPIAVRGAVPGDALAVAIGSVRTDDWGWTVAAARPSELLERLGLTADEPGWLLWSLEGAAGGRPGTGTDQHGHQVALAPFLGVLGTAPAQPGEHSTVPPRPGSGGNIDCRELVEGSVVLLPVGVPGALLCVGDGHARQGDGEVGGTAVECGTTSELTLDLVRDPVLPGVHAETPAGRITFGFDADLNAATVTALDAMLTWVQRLTGLDRASALALASAVVDLRVTQVANQTWGVHAVLPAGALRLPDASR